jgi:uncharacterized membrane protein
VFPIGRTFFGLATTASGILQLATGEFVRIVPKLPAWVPAPSGWAYLFGVILVALGLAILSGRMARAAASVLGVMILLDVAFLYVPSFFNQPEIDRPFLRGFMYTNPLKCLALAGGAALIGGVARSERLAPVFLAAFLIVCGLQHFTYNDFVTNMVPAWIPPGQRFWAYFSGIALLAGGIGILLPRTARLAASVSALMIFLWVPLLHIPRALAGPNHANETAGVFEALAISGVCLLVAGSRLTRR